MFPEHLNPYLTRPRWSEPRRDTPPGPAESPTESVPQRVRSRLAAVIVAVALLAGPFLAAPARAAEAAGPDPSCARLVWDGIGTGESDPHVYSYLPDTDDRVRVSSASSLVAAYRPDAVAGTGHVVFSGRTDPAQTAHLYIADRDRGGVPEAVSGFDPDAPLGSRSPLMSPDGTSVAWIGDVPGESGGVWVADSSGANRRRIPPIGVGNTAALQWDASGSKLVRSNLDQAYVVGVDDGSVVDLRSRFDFGPGLDVLLSPDGRWVVGTGDHDGAPTLAIADLESSAVRRIPMVHPLTAIELAEWAPDSRSFVATASGGPDRSIVVFDTDLEVSRPVPGAEENRHQDPHWSPDGSMLAWHDLRNLYRLDLNTGEETVTRPAVGIDELRGWSADGRWLAWSVNIGGAGSEILAIGPEQELVQVTAERPASTGAGSDDPAHNNNVRWAHGGGSVRASASFFGSEIELQVTNDGPCAVWPFVDSVCGASDQVVDFGRVDPGATTTVLAHVEGGDCAAPLRVFGSTFGAVELVPVGAPGPMTAGDGPICGSFASHPFVDVGGSFAEADVACLFGLGITTGTSASTFAPGDVVTREQMAAFLGRTIRAVDAP